MSFDIPIKVDTAQIFSESSKTPKINFETGRITGYCDKIDAVDQSIKLALLTPRFAKIIYDNQYGCEIYQLLKNEFNDSLFQTEAKRCIKDALICDNRIVEVTDFEFENEGDCKIIKFSVDTIFGLLNTQEVRLGG